VKVLALTKYGTMAASTRQRFLLYRRDLAEAGIELEISPLLDNDYLAPLMRGESPSAPSVVRGYLRRVRRLLDTGSFDLIWVHCEFFPYLPAAAELLAQRLGGRPIMYDFDDAIFHMYDDNASAGVRQLLSGKLEPLLRRAAACCCGNAYLRDYAAQFCANSIILPTVVDTAAYRPLVTRPDPEPLVIGWIGSPSTWPNVRPLLPLLSSMCAEGNVRVRAIGAGKAAQTDQFPGLDLVEWGEATEIAEVQRMDIGIMPLIDRPFERGKSGYKLIQYMACGLPVVASPVGVNREIVVDGENGFLATDESEWRDALTRLISDPELGSRLGNAGRRIAEANYSLASQAPRLIELIKAAGTGNLAPSARPPAASAPSSR